MYLNVYLTIKAWHIIFVVTWFAALFYQVRLYIYVREAQDKPEPEKQILTAQLLIMSKRLLFGINFPSAVLTLILGFYMLYLYGATPPLPTWLVVKLVMVALLFAYFGFLFKIYQDQKRGIFGLSSTFLRVWNEVATVFLIAIVFLVVLKDSLAWVYAVLGLFGIGVLLMVGIKWYKKLRDK